MMETQNVHALRMPSILVCGGTNNADQFKRNVEKLGCKVYWTDGDPGNNFPRFCDAVVFAKYQLSHNKFSVVKTSYSGKPMFIADQSWSTIKERFEEYVSTWAMKNQPKSVSKSPTAMELAMKNATHVRHHEPPKIVEPKTEPKQEQRVSNLGHVMYTPEMKEKVLSAIRKHFNDGLRPRESARELNKAGLRLANGNEFSNVDVSSWRHLLGLRVDKPLRGRPAHKPKAAKVVETPTSVEPKKQSITATTYELILHAGLPPVETTKLMRQLADGKLSQDDVLKYIEIHNDLKGE